MKINHAYRLTKLVNRGYVKRVNDSPDSAIHSTFSHFAAFFIVAVTKRFNVYRFNLYRFVVIDKSMEYSKKKKSRHKQNTRLK